MLLKKIIIPSCLFLCLLIILRYVNFDSPFYFLSNRFVIEAYQSTKQPDPDEKNIVLVNISDLPVDAIKDQIEILSLYEPAVIGVDYFPERSPKNNERIQFKKLVLPLLIDSGKVTVAQNYFTDSAYYGFVNISSYSTFQQKITSKGVPYHSFPSRIVELYNDNSKQEVVNNTRKEIIKYAGNTYDFTYLGDLSKATPELLERIKGKIVLVGYLGVGNPIPTSQDELDVHHTPYSAMFGVVYWANAIYTLLGNQISKLNFFQCSLIFFVIVLANTIITPILLRVRFSYMIIKISQIIQIISLFIISSFLLHRYDMLTEYGLSTFAVIIFPECLFWIHRIKTKKQNS